MTDWIEGKVEGLKCGIKNIWGSLSGKTYNCETDEYENFETQPRDFTGNDDPESTDFNENYGEPNPDAKPIINPMGGVPILGALFSLGMWIGKNQTNPFFSIPRKGNEEELHRQMYPHLYDDEGNRCDSYNWQTGECN